MLERRVDALGALSTPQVSAENQPGSSQVETVVTQYTTSDGSRLGVTVYLPREGPRYAAVVEVHGGAWHLGDRFTDQALNCYLARHGIVVAAIDTRIPPQHPFPASLDDVTAAVGWLGTSAAEFGVSPDAIGIAGTSSGGHLAMLASLRGGADWNDAVRPGWRPRFVVLRWPVIDPLARYRHALELRRNGGHEAAAAYAITGHELYWASEAQMDQGRPTAALDEPPDRALPAVLYLQLDPDILHPLDQAYAFLDAYRAHGGTAELCLFRTSEHEPGPETGGREIVAFVRAQTSGRAAV